MENNYDLYKLFYIVANEKNITKAANYLMISQPGISRAIKTLEEELNCTLFVRSKQGVKLTDAGKLFYEEVKKGIEIFDNAEKKLSNYLNLESGSLNIGASKTVIMNFLFPFIKMFNEKYPNIDIKIHTDSPDKLIVKARNGLIDLVFVNYPCEVPGDFNYFNIKMVHDVFVANDKFNSLKDKKIPFEELIKYPLIIPSKGGNTRYYFDKVCNSKGLVVNPKYEFTSSTLVYEFAVSGFGIGLITEEYFKNEVKDKNLFVINTDYNTSERHIGYMQIGDSTLSPPAKYFIKLVNDNK